MPEPKPALVKPLRSKPALSLKERREHHAYMAAHRILAEVTDYGQRELVCPGGIRSRRIDMIAAVILEEFGDIQ